MTGSVILTFWLCPAGEPAVDTAHSITMGALPFWGNDEHGPGFVAVRAPDAFTMPAGYRNIFLFFTGHFMDSVFPIVSGS